ncbi:MAG: hypothetical protein JNM00_08360 [Flavobacteriales bacterium]|nr:hypothetical protein [Flavobacteriales bacterium]
MIVLAQHILHAIEAHHDHQVIKGSDPTKLAANRAWHKWDAVQWVSIYLLLCIAIGIYSGNFSPWYLFSGLNARQLMMQVYLNNLCGLPEEHLSDVGWDGFVKRTVGETGALYIAGAISIVTIFYDLYVVTTYLASLL